MLTSEVSQHLARRLVNELWQVANTFDANEEGFAFELLLQGLARLTKQDIEDVRAECLEIIKREVIRRDARSVTIRQDNQPREFYR